MTTALIADDESLLRDDLRDKLTALWPDLVIVAEAANGNEAADLIARHEPDIAFLDIKMPGQTGIEVAQGIETDTRVVFVTAYDQYAVDAFEREAIDYLLKPVTRERLAQTVTRLKNAVASDVPEAAPAPELAQILNLLARAGGGATAPGSPGAAGSPCWPIDHCPCGWNTRIETLVDDYPRRSLLQIERAAPNGYSMNEWVWTRVGQY